MTDFVHSLSKKKVCVCAGVRVCRGVCAGVCVWRGVCVCEGVCVCVWRGVCVRVCRVCACVQGCVQEPFCSNLSLVARERQAFVCVFRVLVSSARRHVGRNRK